MSVIVAVCATAACSAPTVRAAGPGVVDDGASLVPVDVATPLIVRTGGPDVLDPLAAGERIAGWDHALDAARVALGACTSLTVASGASAYEGLYTTTSDAGPAAVHVYNQVPAYVIRAVYTPCPGRPGASHPVVVVVDAGTAEAIGVVDNAAAIGTDLA